MHRVTKAALCSISIRVNLPLKSTVRVAVWVAGQVWALRQPGFIYCFACSLLTPHCPPAPFANPPPHPTPCPHALLFLILTYICRVELKPPPKQRPALREPHTAVLMRDWDRRNARCALLLQWRDKEKQERRTTIATMCPTLLEPNQRNLFPFPRKMLSPSTSCDLHLFCYDILKV